MSVRPSVRAGSFYEASESACRRHAQQLVSQARLPDDLPSRLFGGLVPHAGWMFSGVLAAKTLKAIAVGKPATVVLLGADHVGTVHKGEVYDAGAWRTPLGVVPIDEALAKAIIDRGGGLLRAGCDAHAHEHSIEVQVPLLQTLLPEIRIVPIAVPPISQAVDIGRAIGQVLARDFPGVPVVGSTDLTHHGGNFGNWGGSGQAGEQFTRQNDRRMLDLVGAMEAEAVVPEASERQNACGAGAVAACIAACREMGASGGVVLEYTNSYIILHAMNPSDPDDTTVGYASVVFV